MLRFGDFKEFFPFYRLLYYLITYKGFLELRRHYATP